MNDITNNVTINSAITSVSFHQLESSVCFATKFNSVIAIWESDYLDGGEDLLLWKKITISSTSPEGADIYFFTSNSDSQIDSSVWSGPYRNSEYTMSTLTKRYLKIRIVLIQKGELRYEYNYQTNPIGPYVDSITAQCVISGTASKFFTDVFDIGFNPKYILLTSETDIPEGAIVRYGVTNLDTTNTNYYQFFEKDKITKLNRLPVTGQKIKLYIEMSGTSGETITVHEFATMFSGTSQYLLNQ